MRAKGGKFDGSLIKTPDCPGVTGVHAKSAKCSAGAGLAFATAGLVVVVTAAFALDLWPKLGGN